MRVPLSSRADLQNGGVARLKGASLREVVDGSRRITEATVKAYCELGDQYK